MHIRRLIPLAVAAFAVAVPAQAHADVIPGVPPQLQQPVQQLQQQAELWQKGLPLQQQDQVQRAIQPLPEPLPRLLPPPPPVFPNNLDGWIRNSLYVMAQHRIPGSYDAIHRNVMRESGGNPAAINLWDSNAAAGMPSKGLMQVIDPTFHAYHVDGTSWDIYNPVANITAACNYAAHRYGSIDNVYSAY